MQLYATSSHITAVIHKETRGSFDGYRSQAYRGEIVTQAIHFILTVITVGLLQPVGVSLEISRK